MFFNFRISKISPVATSLPILVGFQIGVWLVYCTIIRTTNIWKTSKSLHRCKYQVTQVRITKVPLLESTCKIQKKYRSQLTDEFLYYTTDSSTLLKGSQCKNFIKKLLKLLLFYLHLAKSSTKCVEKKPNTTLNVTQMTVILYFITSKRLLEIRLLAAAKLCMHLCSTLTAVLPVPQIAFAILILNASIYALTFYFRLHNAHVYLLVIWIR